MRQALPRLAVATAFLFGLAVAPGASACTPATLGPGFELPVLVVEVTSDRSNYRRGARATVQVRVTQLDRNGPRVRNAVTGVTLSIGKRTMMKLGGSTDANGGLVLPFTVPKSSPVGAVKAQASSRVQLVPGPDCNDILFATGTATVDPLMTISA